MHSIGFPTTMIFSHGTIIKTCCYFGRGGGGGAGLLNVNSNGFSHFHLYNTLFYLQIFS